MRRGHATRQSLLEAACELFADKGYWDATVAEICKIAGANVAALNYYFGDKASAYREAWQYAFDQGIKAHPVAPADAPANASPAERLHAHVTSLLIRMNDDGRPTRFERMRIWEITRPSGIIDAIDQEVREESRQHMLSCLRDLIGVTVSAEVLQLCEASILSQCRMVLPFNRRDLQLLASRRIDPVLIKILADHIVAFSVAGLKSYSSLRKSNIERPRTGRRVRAR
jgi:TetR/AcrR family transcriptional regulator, regulator of cefoperazone and chloramphenicol sensitivity